MSNDRMKDIDNILKYTKNNNLDILMQKYKEELIGYKYIESLDDFTTLRLKGNIRYINKYDNKLRMGGLLVKIYNNDNGWNAIILQPNKKYYISFNNNYIFYQVSKDEQFRKWAECFVSDVDKGIYNIN
jgi:hypothetical protein